MITEDYVSFEVAKLLKEKGFYGECFSMYLTPKPHFGMGNPNESKIAPHGRDSHYYEGYLYQCEAPTHQMAMKWLRMEKDIQIEITIVGVEWESPTKWYYGFRCQNKEYINRCDANFTSYEEACETAIKYCLENLL